MYSNIFMLFQLHKITKRFIDANSPSTNFVRIAYCVSREKVFRPIFWDNGELVGKLTYLEISPLSDKWLRQRKYNSKNYQK